MITDKELEELKELKKLMDKIDDVSANYVGFIDDLTQIVGMVIVGRRYGWKVIRLVNTRRHWKLACKHFGDLKEILPERGDLSRKSIGLSIADTFNEYWEVIRGHRKMDIKKRKYAE